MNLSPSQCCLFYLVDFFAESFPFLDLASEGRPKEGGAGREVCCVSCVACGVCVCVFACSACVFCVCVLRVCSACVFCMCALCCAVLCCAVLCCAVLCCAVLCCAALRCAALRCAALRCAALRCAALRCVRVACALWCVLWLCGCVVVWLCGCVVVRLCGCAVVRLCGCAVVRLCGCAVVRLCGVWCVVCGVHSIRWKEWRGREREGDLVGSGAHFSLKNWCKVNSCCKSVSAIEKVKKLFQVWIQPFLFGCQPFGAFGEIKTMTMAILIRAGSNNPSVIWPCGHDTNLLVGELRCERRCLTSEDTVEWQ